MNVHGGSGYQVGLATTLVSLGISPIVGLATTVRRSGYHP